MGTVTPQIGVGGVTCDIQFHCVDQFPSSVALGMDLIHKACLVLDFITGSYWCEVPDSQQIRFPILGARNPTPADTDKDILIDEY